MRDRLSRALLVLALAAFAAAFAENTPNAAARFDCPPQLKTDQAPASVPAGFAVYPDTAAPQRLSGISLFDGPPSEQADLKPDKGDEPGPALWTMSPRPKRPYWMVCRYRETTVRLARPLPEGFAFCRAILTPEGNAAGLLCGNALPPSQAQPKPAGTSAPASPASACRYPVKLGQKVIVHLKTGKVQPGRLIRCDDRLSVSDFLLRLDFDFSDIQSVEPAK